MILIWTAIYLNSNVQKINGFSLSFIYIYMFMFMPIVTIVSLNLYNLISQDIKNGGIAINMIRSVNYSLQLFFSSIGENIIYVLFVSLPLIAIILFFVHVDIGFISLVFLAIEFILAIIFFSIFDFLIGISSIYLVDLSGLSQMIYNIIYFLGGGIIPIIFFPTQIKNILMLLPFQMLGFTEIATMLNIISTHTILTSIAVTIFSIFILFIATTVFWRKAVKKLSSIGG
ncbi:MAG: ABC-2 family transporter protein [Candidatus Marsarchaeota archaeon]|nr:ABC-2 family transporter protein [Candidatus Marsarchaeota archaeon]